MAQILSRLPTTLKTDVVANIVLESQFEDTVSDQELSGLGPFLNLATICERFILEQDGALTLFRIIDRFNIIGNTEEMPATTVQFNLVTSFRSGQFVGSLNLGVTILTPSMESVQEIMLPLNFEQPPEKSAPSIGQINLLVTEPGLYWLVLKLAERECTRVPLRISYQRQPMIQAGTSAGI